MEWNVLWCVSWVQRKTNWWARSMCSFQIYLTVFFLKLGSEKILAPRLSLLIHQEGNGFSHTLEFAGIGDGWCIASQMKDYGIPLLFGNLPLNHLMHWNAPIHTLTKVWSTNRKGVLWNVLIRHFYYMVLPDGRERTASLIFSFTAFPPFLFPCFFSILLLLENVDKSRISHTKSMG